MPRAVRTSPPPPPNTHRQLRPCGYGKCLSGERCRPQCHAQVCGLTSLPHANMVRVVGEDAGEGGRAGPSGCRGVASQAGGLRVKPGGCESSMHAWSTAERLSKVSTAGREQVRHVAGWCLAPSLETQANPPFCVEDAPAQTHASRPWCAPCPCPRPPRARAGASSCVTAASSRKATT